MSVPESEITGVSNVRPPTNQGGSAGASTARQVAGTAKDQAADLGADVGAGAKAVAGVATQQAKATIADARHQARRVAAQGRDEVVAQLDGKSQQAASGLQAVAGQLGALAEGRTTDAGPFGDYARQASTKAQEIAERLESGGAQGVVDDVVGFARRRPGLFLLGAAGAGFLVGRLVRSGKAAMDDGATTDDRSGAGVGSATVPTFAPTTGLPTTGFEPIGGHALPAPEPLVEPPIVPVSNASGQP